MFINPLAEQQLTAHYDLIELEVARARNLIVDAIHDENIIVAIAMLFELPVSVVRQIARENDSRATYRD
jgi:hypothetical protein